MPIDAWKSDECPQVYKRLVSAGATRVVRSRAEFAKARQPSMSIVSGTMASDYFNTMTKPTWFGCETGIGYSGCGHQRRSPEEPA